MELYIVRHALAEPLSKHNGFSDEKRVLTDEGRKRLIEVVKGLRKLGVEPDLILTSPLARALQTAEVMAESLGMNRNTVQQTTALSPGAMVEQLFAEIKSQDGMESIALVGHQPDLGKLISTIINSGESDMSVQLKKAGVCCINVTETVPALRGELLWLLAPKQLRMFAKS